MVNKLKMIPLSNDAIGRRIEDVQRTSRKVLTMPYRWMNPQILPFLCSRGSTEIISCAVDLHLGPVGLSWRNLADVFEHLNTLNVSMQERGHNIFEQCDKITVFKKIAAWVNHVSKDRLDMFPSPFCKPYLFCV